jgi:threonine synthase
VRYVSTRGAAERLAFDDVVLSGLARDGGLYVPEAWPRISEDEIRAWGALDYPALAVKVMMPFMAGSCIGPDRLFDLVSEAYAGFRHQAVTPLSQLGTNDWLLELYHGPTLAFKDLALQCLGRLFDDILAERGQTVTIVGATSGDTGSAAIEAVRDRDNVRIFMLHPRGRVSEVQRRQMTSVMAPNVFNIAVDGNFDDCQALVKELFNDLDFRDGVNLSAVNSINWARVMAQVVYYFHAALSLGGPGRPVAFSVPTGNFGDVFAGYVAARMGLPVAGLVVATNVNDILARTLNSGAHRLGTVTPTISPSMDIQVSSNFERLLFDLYDRDGGAISRLMTELKTEKGFALDQGILAKAAELFRAERVDEDETRATMAAVWRDSGRLIDPHTAVGLAAARRRSVPGVPMVTLSTAHPAKFPDAVKAATGEHPTLPKPLADLLERPERFDTLANDTAALKAYILARREK